MALKKTILYFVCVVALIVAGKTLWELINFNDIAVLHLHSKSIAYKSGRVAGMVIRTVGYFSLVIFIYNRFLKIKVSKLA